MNTFDGYGFWLGLLCVAGAVAGAVVDVISIGEFDFREATIGAVVGAVLAALVFLVLIRWCLR